MKSILLCVGILLILSPLAQAENFYSPLLCPIEETYLKVQNKSSEPQTFWFQSLGSSPFTELQLEIKARGELTLPLTEYFQNENAIALKTQNDSLTFKAFCTANQLTWNLESTTSPWKKISISPADSSLRLFLTNLSQQANPLEIIYEFPWGSRLSQSLTLPEEFAAISMELNLPFGITSVKVRGQGRWTGKALTSKDQKPDQELFLNEETMVLASAPAKRYFLFEAQNHNSLDSFVVPLENPKLIAESLEQIAHPERARLLVARIEKSLAGTNRDFSSPVKSPWSWQVLEAQNYADLAHISCDGTPTLVEERLNSWLLETGGTICFWNYRVVRELTLQELRQHPTHLDTTTKPIQ